MFSPIQGNQTLQIDFIKESIFHLFIYFTPYQKDTQSKNYYYKVGDTFEVNKSSNQQEKKNLGI